MFLDFALEALFSQADAELPDPDPPPAREPDPDALASRGPAARGGRAAGAGARVRRLGRPGRGRGPALRRGPGPAGGGQRAGPRHPGPRRRRAAGHPGPRRSPSGPPTWWWWPGPRSTSGSATAASAAATAAPRPRWCTWSTPPARWPGTSSWPAAWPATSAWSWTGWSRRWPRSPAAGPTPGRGGRACATRPGRRSAGDRELLDSDADPIHPARVYGELLRVLADDAVVIGDGGDFVSFAGRFVEPARPGNWLDPGPYGCLGTGLGYAVAARLARPSAQVVLLLGDGAAGFSLMDVDTLVRHHLPVVIVCRQQRHLGRWRSTRCGCCTATTSSPTSSRSAATTWSPRPSAAAGELVTTPADAGPGPAPGLRRRRPLPGQRGHRPRGRLPPLHLRPLSGTVVRRALSGKRAPG